MQYFDNLPKIIYTDAYGNQSIRTNLLARASVVNNLLTCFINEVTELVNAVVNILK